VKLCGIAMAQGSLCLLHKSHEEGTKFRKATYEIDQQKPLCNPVFSS
jgi:hypothetical protein